MIKEIMQDAGSRMEKTIDSLRQSLSKIRTGRAHPSLLDHLTVAYYGSEMPISQVANIGVEDARTLTVTPWEKQMVQAIEKSILKSDLGLNPATAGTVIRIPMPPLTQETRRELVKVVRHEGEATKVAIRNIRRDANSDFKDLLKEKEISEDEERKAEDDIQKLTDRYVGEVDKVLAGKETELMEI
jgi:ribosome recycling factor